MAVWLFYKKTWTYFIFTWSSGCFQSSRTSHGKMVIILNRCVSWYEVEVSSVRRLTLSAFNSRKTHQASVFFSIVLFLVFLPSLLTFPLLFFFLDVFSLLGPLHFAFILFSISFALCVFTFVFTQPWLPSPCFFFFFKDFQMKSHIH